MLPLVFPRPCTCVSFAPLPRINSVPCATNTLQTQFNPTWWNGSLSETLQLQITQSDQPVWATTTGLGPQFTVNWNGTTPTSSAKNGTSTGMSVESVRAPNTSGGISGGKLAAAVVVPLLAAALGVAAYVFYSRRKGRNQRKRWSAYVDNRMSHYSTAASQMDGGAGSPGRPSMSMHGHSARPSLAGRPMSTASFGQGGGNFAGVGSTKHTPAASFSATAHSRAQSGAGRPTSSFYALDGHSFIDTPPTSAEMPGRSRPMGTGHGNRVSRVSFAETAYTGGHSKRLSSFFASGAGPTPHARTSKYSTSSIPAMPQLPASAATGYEAGDFAAGVDGSSPHSLSLEEVARLGKGSKDTSPSKWSGKKHKNTVSNSMPFLGNIGGRQSIMSPDDLMKAYAFKAHQPQPADRPDTAHTEASKYADEQQEEIARSSEEVDAPKKGKFGAKFGFGFPK